MSDTPSIEESRSATAELLGVESGELDYITADLLAAYEDAPEPDSSELTAEEDTEADSAGKKHKYFVTWGNRLARKGSSLSFSNDGTHKASGVCGEKRFTVVVKRVETNPVKKCGDIPGYWIKYYVS